MNAYSLFGINEIHRSYSLENPIIINGKEINEIIIWAHYELKYDNYIC